MREPFEDPDVEAGFQKFLDHFPVNVDITLMILKGHLLIEEEINALLSMFVNYQKELDAASLTFFQKVCILRSLFPEYTHTVFNKAETLNRLRNKIAHNLDPKGLNDSITSFLKLFNKVDKEPISENEIKSLLPGAFARLHGDIFTFKHGLSKADLRTFKVPTEND